MKKAFLISLIAIFSSSVFAQATVTYCLEGNLINTKTNAKKASMKCEVSQKLSWDDFSVLFDCDFDGQIGQLFTNATKLGPSVPGGLAWTTYSLQSGEVAKFFQEGLGLSNVKKAQEIKILFSSKVRPQDDFIIIQDAAGIYKLDLNAYLGKCR